MKQIVIVVVVFLIAVFIFSGGFAVKFQKDLGEAFPSPTPQFFSVVGEGDQSTNTRDLQLRTLLFGSPQPTTQPSTNPTENPTPNPTTSCSTQKVAVDMLLDTSSSMACTTGGLSGGPCTVGVQSKITLLKTASINFVGNLHSDDVFGLQRFSDYGENLISPKLVDSNQSQINSIINNLQAIGTTNQLDGFKIAKQQIDLGKVQFPPSEYKWVLIFLTDGVPTDNDGYPNTNFEPTPVALQLKQEGVTIITIGLGIDNDSAVDYIKDLLGNPQKVPSSTADFYDSPQASQLSQIYNQISSKICR